MTITHIEKNTYPLVDLGGDGPPLHIALANGFPPDTYRPLLAPLTNDFRIVSLPPRALWKNPGPVDAFTSWQGMADDLLTGLEKYGLTDVIGVGHSMGGVATALAAIAEPERFRGIILLDPTFLPPPALFIIGLMQAVGLGQRAPLAQGALRRRNRFASVQDAFEHWRKKSFFADWSDDVLWLYAESMTQPTDDGSGVTLTWPRAWESRYYATVMADVWNRVGELDGLLPVLAVRGETTNTFMPLSERAMQRRVPSASYAVIEGHGHLFPHSAPDTTRTRMVAWMRDHDLL